MALDQGPVVQLLLDPASYPEKPQRIEHVQTHISHVFLTGTHAYKLKKAVGFGFLDFTTLEKRRFYCEEEVRLNRRLSPEIYLGVVPVVRRADGSLALGETGEAVDYTVKMLQLPQERMLDARLRRGDVTTEMVDALGRRVAEFHQQAETGPQIAKAGDLDSVRFNVEENFEQTAAVIDVTIPQADYQATAAYSRAFLLKRAELFHLRARDGHVRDCHGDLRPAQVCLVDDRIYILDCIEFNDRFRYSDTAADVAFMSMELEAAGRPDLARAFLLGYRQKAHDEALPEMLPFYQCYRAYVRGKVAGFRLSQPDLSAEERKATLVEARHYFGLAVNYAQTPVGPILLLVGGLVGTGKTTLATGVSRERGYAYLSSDVVRKELAAIPATQHAYVSFGAGIYTPAFTHRTYQELARRAQALLASGRSVVVDATFSLPEERSLFVQTAKSAGAELRFALCAAPESVIRERLEQRVREGTSPSDGRWEIYIKQRETFQPPSEREGAAVLRMETAPSLEKALAALLAWLDIPLQ
ncbi:MAG: AAA family ATPase [Chloroflexi bacterium]|nr:AAA family ATPase [Chloroflexota bacterium]